MPTLRNKVLGFLGHTPVVGPLVQAWHGRDFARRGHAFRGIHRTYAEALAALPSGPTGYDLDETAAFYRERLERVYPADYPMLFWLREVFPVSRVFDVGGHVGVAYYGYQRYVPIAAEIDWCVFDVPRVCESGRVLARERGASNLRFSSSFADADGADVLFASGSLQYLEEPLAVLLGRLRTRPRHLLLNLLPLTEGETFYTQQSIGVTVCPYRIESRRDLHAGLEALGYELVDAWKNPEKHCEIAFHPERSLSEYDGSYWRRAGQR